MNITIISNGGRITAEYDPTTTIREVLETEEIDYAVGVTSLDGSPLKAGDMDKTFEDFGVYDRCYLSVVVKADNAATVNVNGAAIVVTSSLPYEVLCHVQKFRPNALALYEGDGQNRRRVFKVELDKSGDTNGELNDNKALFSTTKNNEGLATITMLFDPEDAAGDLTSFIHDTMGAGVLRLNKVEAQCRDIMPEIEQEKAAVAACINIA